MAGPDHRETSLGVQADAGVGSARGAMGLTPAELVALSLSVLWILGVAVFFFAVGFRSQGAAAGAAEAPSDPLRAFMVALAVFMPLALIWIGTMAVTSARVVRDESRRLGRQVEAMRVAYLQQQQAARSTMRPSVERKLDELVAAQRETGAALATFTTRREDGPKGAMPVGRGGDRPGGQPGQAMDPAPPMAPPMAASEMTSEAAPEVRAPETGTPQVAMPESADPARGQRSGPALGIGPLPAPDQPSLQLRAQQARPISTRDFIDAINFPESPEDEAGFRALRRAMQDPRAARLIQASQDVLTLLSQEGLYMDDLRPRPADPAVWRRFAAGERGAAVADLMTLEVDEGLEAVTRRMRQDPVFRDTAHHFLRRFDAVFAEFEKSAGDADIADLAGTRTALAFMVVGRSAGTFDAVQRGRGP